ncbi:MAG: DUF2878 domain-containing protein [Exilibacterium sp.]
MLLRRRIPAENHRHGAAFVGETPVPRRGINITARSRLKYALVNAFLFQLVWLACVQAHNRFALAVTACYLVFHHAFFVNRIGEWRLVFGFAAVGYLADSLIQITGLVHFNGGPVAGFLAPVWLACLWLAFCTTLNHSLAWLRPRPFVSLLIGLFLAPFTYWLGVEISGSQIASPSYRFFLAEAVLWSLLLPVATQFTEHTAASQRAWR